MEIPAWIDPAQWGVWRPAVSALALPPVPPLLLAAWGLTRIRRAPRQAFVAGAAALLLSWACAAPVVVEPVAGWLLEVPPPLAAPDVHRLATRHEAGEPIAIVVLGGGVEALAPEYGRATLAPRSAERLQYGLWLARRTSLPLAYSGGLGLAGHPDDQVPEAAAAAIDVAEAGLSLRWQEPASRTTRENARFTVPLLAHDGVHDIVLVTHGWHMPRAVREFEQAATANGGGLRIVPAPMGLGHPGDHPMLRWLPSADGLVMARNVLREWYALKLGL